MSSIPAVAMAAAISSSLACPYGAIKLVFKSPTTRSAPLWGLWIMAAITSSIVKFIVGLYLAPDKNLTIEDVIAAIIQRTRRGALLVVGDLNTNLTAPEGRARDKVIVAAMATAGLEDINGHFLSQRKPWLKYGNTWSMIRGGQELCSRTNYILGTDHYLLQNVAVRDARPNTEHYLVLGCIRGAMPDVHLR